jgi:hypothetical protein
MSFGTGRFFAITCRVGGITRDRDKPRQIATFWFLVAVVNTEQRHENRDNHPLSIGVVAVVVV